jgi:hypothetical protein
MDIEEILGNEENKAKLFEGLKAKGFDVFDEAKKAELINNSTTEKIKAREFELKVGYEKDIQDLTGEVKGVNEKTHEYLKRVLGGSLSKAKELEAKLNSSPNADDTIKQIQDSFSQKEQDYLKQIGEYESKITNSKKDSIFNDGLKSLNLAKDVDPEYLELKLNQIKAKYLNNLSFDEQGNAVLLDAEGKTLRNESNNMNPFTIQEVLSKELDKFIAVERTVEGASTNTPNPANPNADVPKDLETFVKSKVPKTEGEVQKFVQDYYISKNQNPRGREAIKNFANISKMLGF